MPGSAPKIQLANQVGVEKVPTLERDPSRLMKPSRLISSRLTDISSTCYHSRVVGHVALKYPKTHTSASARPCINLNACNAEDV